MNGHRTNRRMQFREAGASLHAWPQRWTKKMIRNLLSATIILAAMASTAFSCICGPKPLEEHILDADIIFTGTIEKMEKQDRTFEINGEMIALEDVKVTFHMTRVLKGDMETEGEINVFSGLGCSVFFDFHESYLVYARKVESGYATSSCSETKSLTPMHRTGRRAKKYMKELQEELELVELLVEDATNE